MTLTLASPQLCTSSKPCEASTGLCTDVLEVDDGYEDDYVSRVEWSRPRLRLAPTRPRARQDLTRPPAGGLPGGPRNPAPVPAGLAGTGEARHPQGPVPRRPGRRCPVHALRPGPLGPAMGLAEGPVRGSRNGRSALPDAARPLRTAASASSRGGPTRRPGAYVPAFFSCGFFLPFSSASLELRRPPPASAPCPSSGVPGPHPLRSVWPASCFTPARRPRPRAAAACGPGRA